MMMNKYPEEKREFLKWLRTNHKIIHQLSNEIIDYLIADETALSKVDFVLNSDGTPFQLILSTYAPTFLYQRDGRRIINEKIILDDIKNTISSKNATLYLDFRFIGRTTEKRFLNLLSENPFIDSSEITHSSNEPLDEFLNSTLATQEEQLKLRINKALDDKNKREFYALTEALNNHLRNKTS